MSEIVDVVEVENNENYKRIKITGIPGNIRNQAFLDLCSKFGRVTATELVRKKDNQIGFASYITTNDAQYAVYRLTGYNLQGQVLNSYPAPLTAEQIQKKQEEEARKRSERETNFVKKVKTKKGPSKGSLRFLTPVNPTFDNGEFVQVGVSIPARGNRKRTNNQNKNTNSQNGQNKGNQTNTNTTGNNQNKGNQTNTNTTGNNQNKGNQNKGNQNKGNQNQTNQNKANQNGQKRGNQNKVNNENATGKNQKKGNQNKGNQNGQKKANQNQTQQGQRKYRRKQEESVISPSDSPLLDTTPDTYFEVTVTNTTTNEVVLKLLRRQDELDKPIILQQEIAF